MQHPGERYLGGGATLAPPGLRQPGAQRRQVEPGERVVVAEVVRDEPGEFEVIRQEARSQRRPGEDPDAALDREREDLGLGVAVEQAVLVLQRAYGADAEHPLDVGGGVVRDAPVADLAFVDQALHLGPGVLDRRRAVDIVELQQIDALAPQPAQARVDIGADRPRAEVHPVTALRVGQRAALGEDQHVVSPVERTADDLLRAAPPIERRRVDPVQAEVERRVDSANRLRLVLRSPPHRPVASRPDRRGADADRRDLHVRERTRLHDETLRAGTSAASPGKR